MKKRVEIISKKQIFKQAIFRIDEVRLRHERYDGTMSDEIVRINLDRGDGAAALVHRTTDDTLLFTEQFRYSTYDKGPGWMLEVPAGMLDGDEDPAAAMQRELQEEIGYRAQQLHKINTFYLSPGGTSERIHLFYARVTESDSTSDGGGLDHEGENIRTVALQVDQALEHLQSGAIVDAKTIIALQWLQFNRTTLPG